ncbi:MAG: VCBS repeat-containing protein, partial [Pyrinomonadaceae bacterium]|nr:VCBS repeat-containing protein [Pyrinomonadaceae bacterium]
MSRNSKYLIRTFTLFIALFIPAAVAFAAPPANDNLTGAVVLNGPTGSINGTAAEATRESGEPEHANTGTVYSTVWYTWTASESKPVVFEISSHAFDSAIAVYTGSSFPLQYISLNNDTFANRPRIAFEAVAGTEYKIAVGLYGVNGNAGEFTLQWSVSNTPTNDNFANALVLPSTLSGSVAITNQNATVETGEPVHVAGSRSVWVNFTNTTPHDYGMTFVTRRYAVANDTTVGVYSGNAVESLTTIVKNDNRPAQASSEVRFIARSGQTYRIAVDGGSGSDEWSTTLEWQISTVPAYSDFGTDFGSGHVFYDRAADITVFRPSTGTWWIRNSHTGAVRAVQFGLAGDTPVQGDYDGDGLTDLAVTRDEASGKVWYIRNSFDGSYTIMQFGLAGDKPVTGDYDYDGRVDIAVFRPSNGTWYIRRSKDNSVWIKEFGFETDIPVVGDFKGTAPGTDIAVYRPSNGTWYVLNGDITMFTQFG